MALETLQRAVELAAREGYIWVFTSRGNLMLDLLRAMLVTNTAPAYAQDLVDSFAVSRREQSPPADAADVNGPRERADAR